MSAPWWRYCPTCGLSQLRNIEDRLFDYLVGVTVGGTATYILCRWLGV